MNGRKFTIVLLAVLSALAQPLRPAKAEQPAYNPEVCKQDARDNIYISLGRYVFPMAYAKQQAVVYDPLSSHNSSLVLKVPDPNEQKGCLGNPLQSTSHAFFTPRILAKGGQLASVDSALRLMTLYRLDRGDSRRKSDEIWPGEKSQLSLADLICKNSTLREDLPNGMSACRIKPTNPPNARQEDWAATYTARPDVYTTPMDRPFVVNCGPILYSDSISHCDVVYEIMDGLGVSYRLMPYLHSGLEPIDHIIEIDKLIRAAIADSIVKDYPWPNQSVDGP
jgi:hypothetical protein